MKVTGKSVLLLLLAIPACASGDDTKPNDEQILAWLKELKPLPKVHYSWPVPLEKLSDELLYEYVRLTQAVSVSGEWGTSEQIEQAVTVCKRVNADKPKVPASIGINYSVWHRRFGKDLPPTDIGPTHQAELDYVTARMETIRDALAAANQKHETDVAVSAILFDSEHFHVRPDDSQWNDAITAKYDAATDIVRRIFPKVRIEWYARGGIHPGASSTGWSESTYFTLDEKAESFGCSLYQVPEIGYTREIFRRTAQNAEQHDCAEVTPWIALASGYRRQTDKYHEFSLDWNYDLIYSWQLGAEVNHAWFGAPERHERFAPWNMAKIAIFYPEPFGRTPHWPEHFVAYVRGAALDQVAAGSSADMNTPPLWVICGGKDLPGRAEINERFVQTMKVAGHNDTTLLNVAGRDHSSIVGHIDAEEDEVASAMLEFIRTQWQKSQPTVQK